MDQFSESEGSDPFFTPSPPPELLAGMPAGIPAPPPPPTILALPPLATYATKEALFEGIQKWAKSRGYAFTIQRSVTTGSRRKKVYYACDRRFIPRLAERQEPRRSTQSRGTGCLFSVLAVESPSLG